MTDQKTLLSLTLTQLRNLYDKEFPDLMKIAESSEEARDFKLRLDRYVERFMSEGNAAPAAIRRLIEFDGRRIHELSTGKRMHVATISLLFSFLKDRSGPTTETDLYIDLYHLFLRLHRRAENIPSEQRMEELSDRWPTGLDREVVTVREENRRRIVHALVHKIHTGRRTPRFHFENGLSYGEKFRRVEAWWGDYRFQLAMAIRSPAELNRFLGRSLSSTQMHLLLQAERKGIPFFITPYYLSLLNPSRQGFDDSSLRSYILYSPQLVETFGNIHAWEKEDTVEAGKANAAGWLLPGGKNIHRRYPEVAILIPDTMGRACGGLCASCQRMYDFQSRRLNFNLETLRPEKRWTEKLDRLMKYFEEDSQIRDILITGGDALMTQNESLKTLLDAVFEMALRKRKANGRRAENGKYAEIQRIRLGTRLPVYLPMRINDELVGLLRDFRERASRIGIRQFIIQTHFQTPLEVTPDVLEGISRLQSAGWLIDNQLVCNVAASRRGHTNQLRKTLNRLGILCYYTFTVKGFRENNEVFAPNSRLVQERNEEKRLGKLTSTQETDLVSRLERNPDPAAGVRAFLDSERLPFLATDRSVLNLPGIGKSMSFRTVGITSDGRRILCFDHDRTRRHSPIVEQIRRVYIVENKSIACYLRQLQLMDEDVEAYSSVWNYLESDTETRFRLYEYAPYSFRITEKVTNLGMDTGFFSGQA